MGAGAAIAGLVGGAVAAVTLRSVWPALAGAGVPGAIAMAGYVAMVVGCACLAFRLSPTGEESIGGAGPVAAASAWLAPVAALAVEATLLAAVAAAVFGVSAARVLADAGPAAAGGALRRRQAAVLVAYGACGLFAVQQTALGLTLVGVAAATLAWPSEGSGRAAGRGKLAASGALAFALAVVATLPSGIGWRVVAKQGGEEQIGRSDADGGQYSAIILIPDPPPEAERLVHPPSGGLSRKARRDRSIPFTGVYWIYYGAGPGRGASVKLGDPVTLGYQATDSRAPRMQARQQFEPPLDLGCCSGISVVVRSREPKMESVALGLIAKHPSYEPQTLGGVWLREGAQAVSFRLPPEVREVDELIVELYLDPSLGGRSARVAIDRFELLP